MKRIFQLTTFAGFLFLISAAIAFAQSFALTDSGEKSADFEARFLASYGVNSAIEPSIGADDRDLYERIAPFLREDPERAIREVEAVITPDSNPAFHFLLGNLYYQTEQIAKAEEHLLQAIDGFPDFRRAHRTLGLIQIRDERYQEAIATWLKVITLGGGDAQSYGLLGYAYLNEQKYASALPAYRMARMFKPDSRDFRLGSAQCLLETDRPRQAVALFEELIAENPEVAQYWLLQANGFLQLERDADAIANLEIVHALGKGSPDSRFMLGNLHLRQNNHTLALKHYKEAVSNPAEGSVASALQPLQHLIARGLIEEAEEYLAALEDYLPDELPDEQAEVLAVSTARIAHASGRTEEAREILTAVVKENPLNADALLFLADTWQEAENFAQAEFYLRRILTLPDRKADALIALGRLEVDRGDLKSALEYLRTAYQIEPRAGLTRYIESIEAAL